MHCRSYAVNDVSFILRENDLSFELLSSAMNACRSLVSWAEFRRTTCRWSATVLSPLVADDRSFGEDFKNPAVFLSFLFFFVFLLLHPKPLSLLLSLTRFSPSPVSLSASSSNLFSGGNFSLSPLFSLAIFVGISGSLAGGNYSILKWFLDES